MLEYLLLIVVTFAFMRWLLKNSSPLKGYNGVPILGVLPFLGPNPALDFMDWGKKLGPIFRVNMGMRNFVVLNSFETIQECLISNWKFSSNRPDMGIMHAIRHQHGVIWAQEFGTCYKSKNKIAAAALKRFPNGETGNLEDNFHREMKYLFEAIDGHNGNGCDIKNLLEKAFASMMCNITFGKRLGWDDKILNEILSAMHELMNNQQDNMYVQFLVMCDWLKYFPPFSGAYKRFRINYKRQESVLAKIINERHKTHDKNVIRDTIDLVLSQQEAEPENPAYTDISLNYILSDFFNAGIDTKVTYFMWCTLYLAANQDVQEKIYIEICENIGKSEIPRYEQREDMPFTLSFIDELHRHRTITPLSLWRSLSKNVTVSGIHIESGTVIIPNTWAVHHSSEYFDDPEEMIPDRFVDKTTGKFVKSPYIMPFGVGMRKCLGYKLAEKELFLTLCNIVQNYKITEDPNFPLPDFNAFLFGFVYSSTPYKVSFKKRLR